MASRLASLSLTLIALLGPIGCGSSSKDGPGDTPDARAQADAPVVPSPDASDSRPAFRDCRGRAFTPAPNEDWRHTASGLVAASGDPGHSGQDQVVPPGTNAALPGKFAYGLTSQDLQDERVQVFLDDCTGWADLGVFATNDDGRISVPVVAFAAAGVYEVRFQVLGDGSTTTSFLWVLPVETRLVVTDIDGTMTQSDAELFMEILTGSHVPVPYPGAVDLTTAHHAGGYVVLYLTGRPYWLTQRTRDWLRDLSFTPGPLRVTDNNADAVPAESGVGDYKKARLEEWLAAGYVIDFAYGNAATDIYAYLGAGLDAADVWIIGAHGGEQGTHAADGTWVPRLAEISALSPVSQPFVW